MLIVWKGGSARIKVTQSKSAGIVVGVGAAVALIVVVFFLPYLYRKIIKDDWTLKDWHIPQGPLLLRRGEPESVPEGVEVIQNYYRGHLTREELDAKRAAEGSSYNLEKHPVHGTREVDAASDIAYTGTSQETPPGQLAIPNSEKKLPPPGPWYSPAVAFHWVKRSILHGVEQDVVAAQNKKDFLSGNIEYVHATGEHYDNKAEYAYGFLQVLTAATSSFCHGANEYVSRPICCGRKANDF